MKANTKIKDSYAKLANREPYSSSRVVLNRYYT